MFPKVVVTTVAALLERIPKLMVAKVKMRDRVIIDLIFIIFYKY